MLKLQTNTVKSKKRRNRPPKYASRKKINKNLFRRVVTGIFGLAQGTGDRPPFLLKKFWLHQSSKVLIVSGLHNNRSLD